jgi:hypothetical protein
MSVPETSSADGSAVVSRAVNAPPDVVWGVLADGWMYGMWVVGASRIREVEQGWPGVGSRIHHSVGLWPALIDDHTEVVAATPNRELLLKARAWPAGEAHVRLTLEAGRAGHTTVSMVEDVTAGAGKLIPRPARQLLITPRNTETLRRLALIAEGRHRERLDGKLDPQ